MGVESSSSTAELSKPRFLGKRYRKDHPHFVRNVLLDGLIAGVLAGAATYSLANSFGLGRHEPVAIGVLGSKTISQTEMKEIVHKKNLLVYWLGGSKNAAYTLDYRNQSAPILAYMTPDSQGQQWGVKIVTIQTYSSHAAFKQKLLGRIRQVADTISTDAKGNVYLTNPEYPEQLVVDPFNTDRVVIINYLVPQSLASLKTDAEELSIVK